MKLGNKNFNFSRRGSQVNSRSCDRLSCVVYRSCWAGTTAFSCGWTSAHKMKLLAGSHGSAPYPLRLSASNNALRHLPVTHLSQIPYSLSPVNRMKSIVYSHSCRSFVCDDRESDGRDSESPARTRLAKNTRIRRDNTNVLDQEPGSSWLRPTNSLALSAVVLYILGSGIRLVTSSLALMA
jgi:hypothetical protein